MNALNFLKKYDNFYFLLGRFLLGIYFIIPGLSKIFDYSNVLSLMILKGIPLSVIALPLTIFLQIFFGTLIVLGKNLRLSALILFCLTILINFFMHNFWALNGDPSQAHETQNFVKNLAIAAGLLILATKENK